MTDPGSVSATFNAGDNPMANCSVYDDRLPILGVWNEAGYGVSITFSEPTSAASAVRFADALAVAAARFAAATREYVDAAVPA